MVTTRRSRSHIDSLPLSQAEGALLFLLLSTLYEHTSVVIKSKLRFAANSPC
jgi:hypothetical protein